MGSPDAYVAFVEVDDHPATVVMLFPAMPEQVLKHRLREAALSHADAGVAADYAEFHDSLPLFVREHRTTDGSHQRFSRRT